MTLWFHSTILATSLAATVAVGLASAAIYADFGTTAAPKSDRLQVVGNADTAYIIFETREDSVSVLTRIPLSATN